MPLQDIPVSVYSTTVYGDELEFSFVNPPLKALDMANHLDGQYTLDVIGTGSGSFTVYVTTSDASGNWLTHAFSGTTTPGTSSRFTLQGAVNFFTSFAAKLKINRDSSSFEINSRFILGTGGTIALLTQPVTIQLGSDFLVTIPAASFRQAGEDEERSEDGKRFVFEGVINDVALEATLTPKGGNSYSFKIEGAGAINLPSSNPVTLRLAIGNNGGSVSVNLGEGEDDRMSRLPIGIR
jgi:hypothetical protein